LELVNNSLLLKVSSSQILSRIVLSNDSILSEIKVVPVNKSLVDASVCEVSDHCDGWDERVIIVAQPEAFSLLRYFSYRSLERSGFKGWEVPVT